MAQAKPSNPHSDSPQSLRPAGLGRRLLAILYDALLLAAVLMVAALPWVLLGPAPDGAVDARALWRLGFQLYLLGILAGFFGWFWTHGGQTLGMRAWRLQLLDARSGMPVGWPQALIRLGGAFVSAALFGLGYAAALADREGRTWHDRLSRSKIVLLAKPGPQATRRNR